MRIVEANDMGPWPESLTGEIAQGLSAGELVVLPTETLYGIALSLRQDAPRRRLRDLMNLGEHPGWVLHVPDLEALERLVGPLPWLVDRLAQKGWPGPLALRWRLSEEALEKAAPNLGDSLSEILLDGKLTARCPGPIGTRQVLTRLGEPATMLGLDSQPSGIHASLRDALTLAVDAGPTPFHRASTLVEVDGPRWQVLRPGVVDPRRLQRWAQAMILFVCSGNTCRSPMAAGLASTLLKTPDQGGAQILSAGVQAYSGMPATPEAVAAAAEFGADIRHHRSQPLSRDLLQRADRIYTMTENHRRAIMDLFPGFSSKVVRLDPRADIADPIGGDLDQYRHVARRIVDLIREHLGGK